MLYIALGLYILNLIVGFFVQVTRFKLGWFHHALYFVVFLSAIIAMLVTFQPMLLITLVALALMPKSKPGTWLHPTIALWGGVGYILTLSIKL